MKVRTKPAVFAAALDATPGLSRARHFGPLISSITGSDRLVPRLVAPLHTLEIYEVSGRPTIVTTQPADPWLAREALRVVARSGDPRARTQLRTVVQDTKRDEDLRLIAISALGNEYATAADGALLREAYRTFDSERARGAVLSAVGSVGGKAATEWLLGIARSSDQSPGLRTRAVQALERIDSPEAINGLITLASPRP